MTQAPTLIVIWLSFAEFQSTPLVEVPAIFVSAATPQIVKFAGVICASTIGSEKVNIVSSTLPSPFVSNSLTAVITGAALSVGAEGQKLARELSAKSVVVQATYETFGVASVSGAPPSVKVK